MLTKPRPAGLNKEWIAEERKSAKERIAEAAEAPWPKAKTPWPEKPRIVWIKIALLKNRMGMQWYHGHIMMHFDPPQP